MSIACSCDTGGGNLGRPNCFPISGVTQKLILTEYFKTDGSVNGILLSSLSGVVDQAFLDSKFKANNPVDRWFITDLIENIVDVRDEDVTQTFNSTNELFVRKGIRKFEGMIPEGDPVLMGQLELWRCQSAGYYEIDINGNLVGVLSKDGLSLNPIRIANSSFSAGLVKATDTELQMNSVKFTVNQLENE